MSVRVEVVTECEHGYELTHPLNKDETADREVMTQHGRICIPPGRRSFTEWPPEAKKRGADALYRLRWGDHPPSQNAAIYAQCEKEAELALAAGWETLTGDNK